MKTGCIIQARMASTRLPGKVLRHLDSEEHVSILAYIIDRVKQSKAIDEIIIATTLNPNDDEIVELASQKGVVSYRGSEEDVLDRYFNAAKENKLDNIIRVTSDCPFIDAGVIDELIMKYITGDYDYVSNCITRTYPHGLDCEIFSFHALSMAYNDEKEAKGREHVTSYIYNHPELFRLGELVLDHEDYSQMRITVDTKSDYALACVIYNMLINEQQFPSFRRIVKLFHDYPFLRLINEDISQKRIYPTVQEEVAESIRILKLQELNRSAQILENWRNE